MTTGFVDEDLSGINKDKKPFKISNVLHKGEEYLTLPKTTYKPGSTSVATPPQPLTEASSSVKSGMTTPFVFKTDARYLEPTLVVPARASSISIQDEIREINTMLGDFSLYRDSQPSSLNTPVAYSPLLGDSAVQGERNSSANFAQAGPSHIPLEVRTQEQTVEELKNIDYGYGSFNPNEDLVTRNPPKMFKEKRYSDSSLYYTEELKRVTI
jgi:hypothetical protein